MNSEPNKHLVLISGKSASGKSASLMGLPNPERVVYANCESGKQLPFPTKFKQCVITDPLQVTNLITSLNGNDKYDTIVVDSLSFLMQMYEQLYVINSTNTMKSWQDYGAFFVNMMQQDVAKSDKMIIFTTHVEDKYNEAELVTESKAVIKGATSKIGVEAYFSCVVMAKRMRVTDLEPYEKDNNLLNITDEERAIGIKYVFQTKYTKETIHEKIRSPLNMWKPQETFIDNNTEYLIQRLREYYDN